MSVNHRVYDVFLSYNSLDRPVVERLAGKLLQRGFRPWYDQWSVLKGQEFQRQIEHGLENSKAIAVFVGPEGLVLP